MRTKPARGVRDWVSGPAVYLLFCIALLAHGCSRSQTPKVDTIDPPQNASAEMKNPASLDESDTIDERVNSSSTNTYRIEIGDEFDVKIYNNPDLQETLVVRPDGRISLLLAEEVQAAGLTPTELDRVITEIYSTRITNPEVTIIMRRFIGNRVYVGGEVARPQEVEIEGRLTLLQAIYKAGGFMDTAKIKSVVLLRDEGTGMPRVRLVNVQAILDVGDEDVLLQPYDAIFVSKTFIAKADKFVDQYINKIVPKNLSAGFVWTYNLTPWMEVFNP
jgi:polysaccharide export outer membrane protein